MAIKDPNLQLITNDQHQYDRCQFLLKKDCVNNISFEMCFYRILQTLSTADAEGEVRPASNFVLLIVPRRYFCGGSFCFMYCCLNFFVLLAPYVCFHILIKLR